MAGVQTEDLERMALGVLAVEQAVVEVEDHGAHADHRTAHPGELERRARLLQRLLVVTLPHQDERARHLHEEVARGFGQRLHLRQDDVLDLGEDLLLPLGVLGLVRLLQHDAREQRPSLDGMRLEVRDLRKRETRLLEVVVHHVQERLVEAHRSLLRGGLDRPLEVRLRLVDRPFLKREPPEADERFVVRGVLRQRRLIRLAGLLHLSLLRVAAGHHVQQLLRGLAARRQVDGVLEVRQRVARLAGTRPAEAAAHEELRRPDVAVVARERTEVVAPRRVVDDVLELLLDLAPARGNVLLDVLVLSCAEHFVHVEERADVVAVDHAEDELVHLVGLRVVAEVLQHHAEVVRDESQVAPQFQPTAVGGILRLVDGARPFPAVGDEKRLHLLPEPVELGLDLQDVDRRHVLHAAEEQAFGNGTAVGPQPEVRASEDRDVLRDVRIVPEPHLQELHHAQFPQREGEVFALLVASRQLLLLDQVGDLLAVGLVFGLLAELDADDVQLLPARGGGHAQVRVQEAVRELRPRLAVRNQPRAIAQAVEELVRAGVRKRAAVALAAERVHDPRQQEQSRKGAPHVRSGLPADLQHRQRLRVELRRRQRDARQQVPIGQQVAAGHRHERRRRHGRRAEGTDHAVRRERRGRGQDAAHRHRRMEEILAPRALVVQAARGGEDAGYERQHGEDDHHEPARPRDPFADFVEVGVRARPQHVRRLLVFAVRRARQLQKRVRDVVRQEQVARHERHEEQRRGPVELEAVLHDRRHQREQEDRHERHEYDAFDQTRRHGEPDDGRQVIGQARKPHEGNVQHEQRQRERHVELAHVQVRRRHPRRRREDEHDRRADARQKRRRARVLDRILLPDRLEHEEPDKVAEETGRQHAGHEPQRVQAHGRRQADGFHDPAPDRVEWQGQGFQAHPLRIEHGRLARIQVPRKREPVHKQREQRHAQRAQPQTPARRGAERFLLRSLRGIRIRRHRLLFTVRHKSFPFDFLKASLLYRKIRVCGRLIHKKLVSENLAHQNTTDIPHLKAPRM